MSTVEVRGPPTQQQHFDAARQFQEFYQTSLNSIGVRVPSPVLGQSVNDYRRETLRNLKRTFLPPVHDMYKVQYRNLESDTLAIFEPQLLRACVTEANNPAHVPPGELRKIERLDDYGNVKTIEFIGQESFVKQMNRPGRRVESFTADGKRYDARKGRWF